jgi:alpha-galactosidase
LIDIKAAGLNHFTWMLDIRDKRTGADLYPLVRERWQHHSTDFEPLTTRMFHAFGRLPVPGDQHLCEYLPWLSNPVTKPWEKYNVALYRWAVNNQRRENRLQEIAAMADGRVSIDTLAGADSEGALEVIESIAGAGQHYHLAVNLPNQGQIANLPVGAIVETPGFSNGAGIQPLSLGALPEGIAELCRRETTVARLAVDAAVHGDRQAALQCLLLDPVVDDIEAAQAILDDYLESYREYLPQFWK